MPNFTVAGAPSQDLALTNCVFLSPSDHALLTDDADLYVEISRIVFTCRANPHMAHGMLGCNSVQRRLLSVSNGDIVLLERFVAGEANAAGLSSATIAVDHVVKGKARGTEAIEASELSKAALARFATQFLTVGQQLVMEWQGSNLLLTVQQLEAVAVSAGHAALATRGMLATQTSLGFVKARPYPPPTPTLPPPYPHPTPTLPPPYPRPPRSCRGMCTLATTSSLMMRSMSTLHDVRRRPAPVP